MQDYERRNSKNDTVLKAPFLAAEYNDVHDIFSVKVLSFCKAKPQTAR